MESTGDVTVVVPTYDRQELLERALDSVRNQTVRPERVVVVDDASPDPVKSFVDDLYDADELTVDVVRHDENRGAAAARNTGVEAADTEYVAFLDSDDYWDEVKLAAQLAVFETDDVGLVYCDQYVVEPDGAVQKSGKELPDGDVWPPLLDGWTAPNTSTLVFDRDTFRDLGGFDTSLDSCQDHDLWMRLAREGVRVGVVEEPLSYFARDADDRISHDYPARMDGVDTFLEKWHGPIAEAQSERAFQRFAADYRAMAALPIAYGALLQRDLGTFVEVVRRYLLFNRSTYRLALGSLPTLLRRLVR
ncbi:glycosyltransferase family 2 protein [Haloarchaeobius salinus]|uniref:glycosyltransferase family 2 protein n=1 Tax=Haloarchaeobius salinus TaxID=1198298 RepID=UPI00210D5630|nr:glycosyltransferase family A protein [Haloarchaeobius salinus]